MQLRNFPPQFPPHELSSPRELLASPILIFAKSIGPALKAKWIAESQKAIKTAKTTDAEKQAEKFSDWLTHFNPEVLPRHLHTMVGATWKDSADFHIDQWLD